MKLWDLRSGQCVQSLPAHSEPLTGVAFSGDGALLASSSYDGLVRLWDIAAGGQCLKTLQEDGAPPVSCVRWAPNDRFLLTASLDAKLRLWDPLSSRRVRVVSGHTSSRFCAAATFVTGAMASSHLPRQLIASGSEDGAACVWDLQTRELVQRLDAHQGPALALDAHPTLDLIATGGSSVAQAAATTAGDDAVLVDAGTDYGIMFHSASHT